MQNENMNFSLFKYAQSW